MFQDPFSPAPRGIRRFVTGRPGPLDRPALPSGHPISWGLITRGTTLDGAAYPFPVFEAATPGDGA